MIWYNILRLHSLLWILILSGCGKESHSGHNPMPVEVSVVTIEALDIPVNYEYVGVTKSSHNVEIRARVAGYLEKIDYVEGAYVHKGDLLFQIDPKPLEAALNDAKGNLDMQEAILWDANRSVDRLTSLYEKKAVSRRDLDTAISQKLSTEAQIASSKAKLEQAHLDLAFATIKAPVSGIAGASNYRSGALIAVNETLLTTISVVDPIWINFSIPERDVLRAEKDRMSGELKFPDEDKFVIEIMLTNGTLFPQKGRIDFLSPTYDQSTGTMMIRGVLPNTESLLKPGQFVRARISGATRPNAIVVPQRSVIQGKAGLYVYIVDKDDKVEIRHIEAGGWHGKGWLVKSGLKSGERVIYDGVNKVRPGMLVKPTKISFSVAAA